MKADEQTLFAFYDLTVSPLSYDFISFLIVAEEERLVLGVEDLHLVIVPFESGVGHWNNTQFGLDHTMWRLNQLVLPLSQLLPSLSGFTKCSSRDHARKIFSSSGSKVYPIGYTVDNPIERHHTGWSILAAHRGKNLQHLRATPESRNYARQWLDEHAGDKLPVALTLREARFTNSRDSNLEVWSEFAHNLLEEGYFPFILRDIDTALKIPPSLFEGITFAPEGVFNLELRMGLYEESHICAFVANGPAQVCFYDRNVQFLYLVTGDWLHNEPTPFNRIGIGRNETPPFCNHFQRWIWQEQSASVLMNAFNNLSQEIRQSRADGTFQSLLQPKTEYRLDMPSVAGRFLQWTSRNQFSTAQEFEIAEICLKNTDNADNCLLEREREIQAANKFREAGHLTEYCQALGKIDTVWGLSIEQCLGLGMSQDALGNFEEAIRLYKRVIKDGKGEPAVYFRLAIAYKNANCLEESIRIFEGMIESGARSQLVTLELGQLYAVTRSPSTAIEFFDYWREQGITNKDIESYRIGLLP